jgi:hypothetical protein
LMCLYWRSRFGLDPAGMTHPSKVKNAPVPAG